MAESNQKVSPLRLLCVSTLLVLLLELEVLSVVADAGNSGSSVCNEDLNSFLPPPYSNTSFCKPIWNTFVLRFSQSHDDVLTVVLSAVYTTGWVGMGFSKNGLMVGSSAMVGWIGNTGRAHVKQFFLKGRAVREVIAEKGNLNVTSIPPAVAVYGATIYLAFQLKLAAPIHTRSILLAFGFETPVHNRLSKHDDKTAILFDFNAGSFSAAPQYKNLDDMKRSHGLLGIFGWGLLLPAGAITARYFRHWDPQWYYLHTFIQFVGFIIGLAGVVAGKVLYDRLNVHIPAHRGIGIFVFVLSILQVLAFFLRPDKDSKIRKYWNWYHHGFGRLALFLGALNVVLGIQIGGPGNAWKVGYGFLLGVVLVTVVVLEVLFRIRASRKTVDPPTFQMNPIQ